MSKDNKLSILATIPTGFCFGLQHITVDFFLRFPSTVSSHFLLTRWGNGEMESLLKKNNIPYSFSWLGMFSRKMDWFNLKMSIHAFIKLPKLYFDFIRLQKKTKPDILYFANHHELILLYPVLLFTRTKIVCHMHDPAPAIPFQKKTFKRYGKIVDKFIAISDNVKMRTIALGCAPEKIITIHNGITIPVLENNGRLNDLANKAGWQPDVFIIGITGQMTATKGHEDLLIAFKKVHEKNPNARLLIGGKPKEPFYSELKKNINESGLDNFVSFTGWLEEVSVFFQNIDVFVLASRHEEGYGLVVAEAMAHKLPVVITASGGAVEIVDDQQNGYIVPKTDPGAMAEKLLSLSVNPADCRKFGENGRIKVTREFNIQKQTRVFVDYLLTLKDPDVR